MVRVGYIIAALLAVGIIMVGYGYIVNPLAQMHGFGLRVPLPDPELSNWLRLKGIRDMVSGIIVFAMMWKGSKAMVGLTLLVEALIPIGDMTTILVSHGSTQHAYFVHGLTALVMLLVGIPLLLSHPAATESLGEQVRSV
jgi:Domain of unknown function (DUF4267)